MTTTRQKILEHLNKVRAASAQELARSLETSPANIRHHLSLLAADGRIEMLSTRKRYGKGRPEKLFSLSRLAQGNNLPRLASALLSEGGAALQPEALAARMLGSEPFPVGPPARRLAALVKCLNEMSYRARWEAGPEGPHVILGLCPYAAIIDQHPELCKVDQALIRRMLGGRVEQLAKLAPACIFAST